MKAVFALLAASLVAVSAGAKVRVEGDRTITQVVKLLQTLLDRSKADGTSEREIYGKFKCYVDSNTADKTALVEELTENIGLFESKIEILQGSSGTLSSEAAQLKADIAENEQAQSEAVALRTKQKEAYDAEVADLAAAIEQMKLALRVLSDIGSDQTLQSAADHSKFMAGYADKGSLLKLQSSMKQALLAAKTFLPAQEQKQVVAFLAEQTQRAPFTGTYSAQSGQIVGILKQMRDTFSSNLNSSMATEAAAVKAHGKFIQTKTEEHGTMTASYNAKQELLGTNDGSLATLKVQLTQATEERDSAQAFLASLSKAVAEKSSEYGQRTMLRTNEEAAIAQAIAILNSDEAFHTFGKVSATSTGATGFLQFRAIRIHTATSSRTNANGTVDVSATSQALVERSLQTCSKRSRKVLRVLALLQAGNPFERVLEEITKMQTLIQKEGKVDQMQLDWCNTERDANNVELLSKNTQIGTLNGGIEDTRISINDPVTGLLKNTETTEDGIQSNGEHQKTETASRRAETKAYNTDISHISEAEALLTKAISVLRKYYKAMEAEELGSSLVQRRRKEEPAPPATWEVTYQGQTGQAIDAVGMLEFILQETHKEGMLAHQDEAASQQAYEESMQALTSEEAKLRKALVNFKKLMADAQLELERKHEELDVTTREKTAIERYLESIKPGCDFITVNFGTREANRAEEMAALGKAIGLIQASPAYKAGMSTAGIAALGGCAPVCDGGNRTYVTCEACLAGVSEAGYCAGHQGTEGC